MTRLREKAQGHTKQVIGQMIGDDRLVVEGQQQIRDAEGERAERHSDHNNFDPAPPDKHADNPKQALKADKKQHDRLDRGLEGSFPASDPASSTQPAKSEPDRKRSSG
jgi:hypothetical protein